MSPRQMVIATLKDATKEILKEQTRLKMVVRSRHEIEAQEAQIRQTIRVLKLRLNRELTANKELLGVVDDEDGEGEGWKQIS